MSVDWARGDPDATERKLAATQASTAQDTWFPALVMGAALARHRGDCRRVVAALEEARAFRFSLAISGVEFPVFLHPLSLCHEKLGDFPGARERTAEVLRIWAKADPGLPLLADAKALQARLVAASSAAPPPC